MDPRPAFDNLDSDLSAAAREISKRELVDYVLRTQASERAMARAERFLPLGVASSFQFYEPHPLVMKSAAGSRMKDLDGYGRLAQEAGVPSPVARAAAEVYRLAMARGMGEEDHTAIARIIEEAAAVTLRAEGGNA